MEFRVINGKTSHLNLGSQPLGGAKGKPETSPQSFRDYMETLIIYTDFLDNLTFPLIRGQFINQYNLGVYQFPE